MSFVGIDSAWMRAMQSSFRPVAFRLSLSEVAALADAAGRSPLYRRHPSRRLGFGFQVRLAEKLSNAHAHYIGPPSAAAELLRRG